MTLDQATKQLMIREPFYGFILMSLGKGFADTEDRAYVALGSNLSYHLVVDRMFWESISDDQQIEVLKHELLHICFNHLLDYDACPGVLGNIATDAEVNQYLDVELLETLERGCVNILRTFPGIKEKAGSRYYYDFLKSKYPDGKCDMPGFPHKHWVDVEESDLSVDQLTDIEKDLVKNNFDYIMVTAYRNSSQCHGNLPAGLEEYIKELMKPKPQVFNWQAYVRKLFGTSKEYYMKHSRMRQSKRFEGAMGKRMKFKAKMLVAIDTSGSVGSKELADFFVEVKHIWKSGVAVDIAECDACLHEIYPYNGEFNGTIHGRGGTSFRPVVDYYNSHRKEYTTLVYFTDGFADLGFNVNGPSIWIITPDGKHQDYPGKTVYIPNENNDE